MNHHALGGLLLHVVSNREAHLYVTELHESEFRVLLIDRSGSEFPFPCYDRAVRVGGLVGELYGISGTDSAFRTPAEISDRSLVRILDFHLFHLDVGNVVHVRHHGQPDFIFARLVERDGLLRLVSPYLVAVPLPFARHHVCVLGIRRIGELDVLIELIHVLVRSEVSVYLDFILLTACQH